MPGVDIEASPSMRQSMARASIAPASFTGKDRASKIWMTADADANPTGDVEEKMGIVKCTTRFATGMCVCIAIAKVIAYIITDKDVVKTSALDSLGDLVANCMTLYTGYRMSKIDTKAYPVGQNKFCHIGCLVFSSFMFALMFGGALGNLESLVETEDDVGYAALSRFFWTTEEVKGFEAWNKEVRYDDEYKWESVGEDGAEWSKRLEKFSDAATPTAENPLIKYYEVGTDAQKEEAKELKEKKVTKGDIVKTCSEYEDPVAKKNGLLLQNCFLGCCATYKLCLWLYCILIAIPKSGSQVLVALATDKRNDFICTYSAIFMTSLAYWWGDEFFIPEDKVDSAVSLVMCFFIMYSWQQLVVEHATILSMESAEKEYRAEVTQDIKKAIHACGKAGSACGLGEDGAKVYVTSERCTAEIELTIKDPNVSFKEVEKVMTKVNHSISSKAEIEKCLITTVLPKIKEDF